MNAPAVRKLGRRTGVHAFTADRQVSCAEILGPDVSPVAAHVFAAVIRDDRLGAEMPDLPPESSRSSRK
jgi:hypothetical protein